MKRLLIYSLGLLLLLPAACDDPLTEAPFSDVRVDDFYSSETEFDLALNGVYARVWEAYVYKDANMTRFGDQPTNLLIASGGNPNDINAWNWDRTTRNLADWWRDSYPAINEANKILAELENVELEPTFESRIEGETRFLRALFYYNLNKNFHGVPLMMTPIETATDENIYKGRSTYEETWDFIEEDLRTAEERLSPFDPANHAIGRVTAASAQGLLARAHAWQQEWQPAVEAAQRAISHAAIQLEPDYQKIWHPDYENSGEHLFTKSHGLGGSTDNIGNNNVWWMSIAGFALDDGTTIDFARNEDDKGHAFWVNRDFYDTTPDTYRKMYTMRDWMPFYIPKGGDVIMDTVRFPESIGPQMVKYHHLDANYFQRTEVNDNILRTSEMYLIIAEGLNELNGGPTAEAVEAINMVRRRARAVGTAMEQPESVYPDLTMGMSKVEFENAVIEEFAREHIGEGLFRGVLIRHDQYTDRSWATGEVPVSNQQEYKIWFAIPDVEMENNENLVQNDGYFGSD